LHSFCLSADAVAVDTTKLEFVTACGPWLHIENKK